HVGIERSLVAVEVDSDDHKLLVRVLAPDLLDPRHLRATGSTPRGPEIEQHDLTFECFEREVLAAARLHLEHRRKRLAFVLWVCENRADLARLGSVRLFLEVSL